MIACQNQRKLIENIHVYCKILCDVSQKSEFQSQISFECREFVESKLNLSIECFFSRQRKLLHFIHFNSCRGLFVSSVVAVVSARNMWHLFWKHTEKTIFELKSIAWKNSVEKSQNWREKKEESFVEWCQLKVVDNDKWLLHSPEDKNKQKKMVKRRNDNRAVNLISFREKRTESVKRQRSCERSYRITIQQKCDAIERATKSSSFHLCLCASEHKKTKKKHTKNELASRSRRSENLIMQLTFVNFFLWIFYWLASK